MTACPGPILPAGERERALAACDAADGDLSVTRAEWDEFWHHLSMHGPDPEGFWLDTDEDVPDRVRPHQRVSIPLGDLRWQGDGGVPLVDGVVLPEDLVPAAGGRERGDLCLDARVAVRRWLAVRGTRTLAVRVSAEDEAALREWVRARGGRVVE